MFKFILFVLFSFFLFQVNAQSVDPTKPLSGSSDASSNVVKKGLVLEAIIHGKKIPSVIISGKLMKVGDVIGVHELVTVNQSSVVLRSDDGRLTLSIFSNVVVK